MRKRERRRRYRLQPVLLLGMVAGCSGAAPAATAAPEPVPLVATEAAIEEGSRSACLARVGWTGEPTADLERMGRACGVADQMSPHGPPRSATQTEGDAAQRFTFQAPRKGACFRVLATGEARIGELHVHLYAPDGQPVASDESASAHAVVPPDGRYCAALPGVHTVEVSVVRQGGRYALQVWKD